MEAVHWWTLSAKQGNANSQGSLAAVYGLGQGVLQDYVTGHMWANLAAANGSELEAAFRGLLADQMTGEQIAEAQHRARVCMDSNYTDCN